MLVPWSTDTYSSGIEACFKVNKPKKKKEMKINSDRWIGLLGDWNLTIVFQLFFLVKLLTVVKWEEPINISPSSQHHWNAIPVRLMCYEIESGAILSQARSLLRMLRKRRHLRYVAWSTRTTLMMMNFIHINSYSCQF